MARASAAAGTISIVSTAAGTELEAVADGARAVDDSEKRLWFQLYFMAGRAGAEVLVDRAERAGYSALVVTVDTAIVGNRERDTRNGVVLPLGVDARNAWRFGPQLLRHPSWTVRFVRDGMPLDVPELGAARPRRHADPEGTRRPRRC